MLLSFLLVWGSVFSILAGLVASFITHREMVHHYRDAQEPLKQAAQTGALTFLLFEAITLALSFGLPALFA